MKLIIVVFLGFCAFAKSSEFFDDIADIDHVEIKSIYEMISVKTNYRLDARFYDPKELEEISKNGKLAGIIDDFLQKTVAEFNKLLDKFNNLKNDIGDKIDDVIQKAKDILQEKISKIEDKIAEIKMKGGAIKKCAEKYELEINDTKNVTIVGIKECARGIAAAVKEFTAEVGLVTAKLQLNVSRLIALVLECYNKDGTIAIAKCAVSKIREAKNLIEDIIINTTDLLATVQGKIHILVEAVAICKQDHINVMAEKIHDVRIKLDECYNNEIN